MSLVGGLWGCAGQPSSPVNPEYVDGVRQRPLVVEEVTSALQRRRRQLTTCYHRVRLKYGLELPSEYVVRVRVPRTGEPVSAEIMQATQPKQAELADCIVDEVEALEFPPHRGEDLVFDVPIKAPKR